MKIYNRFFIRFIFAINKYGFIHFFTRNIINLFHKIFKDKFHVYGMRFSEFKYPFSKKYPFSIKKHNKPSSIDTATIADICKYRCKEVFTEQLNTRFKNKSIFWILRDHRNHLLGFLWTRPGSIYEPYFWPLMQNDAVIFDVEIFPFARKKKLSIFFLFEVLQSLFNSKYSRCFIETKEWNIPMQRAAEKCGFTHIGTLRTFGFKSLSLIRWYPLTDSILRRKL